MHSQFDPNIAACWQPVLCVSPGRQRATLMAARATLPESLLAASGQSLMAAVKVASAFLAWSGACDSQGHRLPDAWRHVARSVRDAAGTVFGGVSLVHIRPDTKELDLAEPDGMWQDYADDYLEYAASSILRWGDSSRDAPKTLLTYEAWLVRTGRREPYGSNRRLPTDASTLTA